MNPILAYVILSLALIILFVYLFLQTPPFGSSPSKARLQRIKGSPNYNGHTFQNQLYTPSIAEEASIFKAMKQALFEKNPKAAPSMLIPSIKTKFENILPEEEVFIWMGHSSYFLQIAGVKFLVDPTFSGHASPFPRLIKSFKGSNIYDSNDIPPIDFLIITHDHWDHLDYKTIKELMAKVGIFITPLGVGAHLERWGVSPKQIVELDWDDQHEFTNGTIHCTTSRHFSGRSFVRNQTLWASFVLEFSNKRIFISGDSGYGPHFEAIGQKFGGFDYAILENGQYNSMWKYIHLFPEETLQAGIDLKTEFLIPTHSSKFKLAKHDWNEPLQLLSIASANQTSVNLLTPMIGEQLSLNHTKQSQATKKWWTTLSDKETNF